MQRRVPGPIELEVIHGTIRAAELEIEAAVERTSRSPMIRDQHDYRVALFDAKGRKLTGRSYSAIVEPVFEYFGADDIHHGDVFFWNDPYNSSGGIGHVPDLCTTVPIFFGDRLIGFSQVFGHHDDVGGSVPGSLPVHATDSWMEDSSSRRSSFTNEASGTRQPSGSSCAIHGCRNISRAISTPSRVRQGLDADGSRRSQSVMALTRWKKHMSAF